MKKYTFFWGGSFSNWFPSYFTYKGHKFRNSEQAFMWEKANVFGDTVTAEQILRTPDAKESKKLGRAVKNFSEEVWEKHRFECMYDVCLAKFTQNAHLQKMLLEQDNYVEASPYDKVWGIGMHANDPGVEDPANWKGLNLLGQVLDNVRTAIMTAERNK